jgi:soluble lytic murein transglycosylase
MPTSSTRAFWEHNYPACARDLLDRFAGKDPELVMLLQAIMRTESGFDPMALSKANARGLMQLYPPTASRAAQAMKIAYSRDRLFEPEYNVRMAAWLIGRLVTKFRRQWPLAASAYNGGAPAMMKWCRENGKLLLDEFVESIPWSESRRYAKRVTAAFARYAWLEGSPLPELRLVVNSDYLQDGIDY